MAGAALCATSALIGFVLGEQQSTSVPLDRVSLPNNAGQTDVTEQAASSADLSSELRDLTRCETARASLRESVAELTAQRARLREDLEFYRGLVDPENSPGGVRLHAVEWYALAGARVMLRAVLARSGGSRGVATGRMEFRLRGREGEQVREYPIAELAAGPTPGAEYRFSRFQEWEAELGIPSAFQPERLIALITPQGSDDTVVKSWAWPALEANT